MWHEIIYRRNESEGQQKKMAVVNFNALFKYFRGQAE